MKDVCIVGAGLAGLTLAHQLRQRSPELSICVLERRRFPAAQASHKVGESTVEIAAHYLSENLGFKAHLDQQQLPKFGLRLFFRGDDEDAPLERYDEIGASQLLPIPTWQLDRGVFENFLWRNAQQNGIDVLDGVTVRTLHIEPGRHRIEVNEGSAIEARYVIDASGRRGMIRAARELQRPVRHGNAAVWFRVHGDLDIDQWSSDRDWRDRCRRPRRLSTNHIMGPGYWLWLIPLSSGHTSIGLVFDPARIDIRGVSSHVRFLAWLRREHPALAEPIANAELVDFHLMKNYAAGCRQVYSEDGWASTGDSGVFSDPFYSPGADFVAISNTFITELICGASTPGRAQRYQNQYFSFFINTMSLYRDLYPGFGDADLMTIKTAWDYCFYWAILCQLFFSQRMLDEGFMDAASPALTQAATLNASMQQNFRLAAEQARRTGGRERFVDHYQVPWFHELKHGLIDGKPDDALTTLRNNVTRLQVVADSLDRCLGDMEGGGVVSLAGVAGLS